MNLNACLPAVLMTAATLGGAFAAAPALAHDEITISYRDHDGRYDRRGDHDRWDRDDRRRGWNGYDRRYYGYGYGYRPRCWTELRYDRWSRQRYAVRICR
jgi:hypothetical protein